MDDKTLQELKAKVEKAEKLKQQIDNLDELIDSCDATVGFLNITANYRNQNEIRLVEYFGPKEVFDAFKKVIQQAALDLQDQLAEEYKNLK